MNRPLFNADANPLFATQVISKHLSYWVLRDALMVEHILLVTY